MDYRKLLLVIGLKIFLLMEISFAQSTLVTISENPEQQSSSLSGVSEFSFDNLSIGNQSNVTWDGVGSFDNLLVENGYFGFGSYDESTGLNSQFNWVGWPGWRGNDSLVSSTTLTLEQESSYFGLYWSAGDGDDLLRFYNDENLVAEFSTQSIIDSASLTLGHYGDPNHPNPWNPNLNYNNIEPYAFINFYGDENTSWDSVVLTQTSDGGSGFETDNLSVRTNAFDTSSDDVNSIGSVIAEVSGTETSAVDSNSSWAWAISDNVSDVPAAPVPPVILLVFFAIASVFRFKSPS